MNQLNSIILEGNAVKVPEVKEMTNFTVATFPIAVNRYVKKSDGSYEEEVSYFEIECWGNFAKVVKEKVEKGSGVRIVGRLKQNRWKDSDGKMQSKVYVVAEHIEFKAKKEKIETDVEQKEKEPVTQSALFETESTGFDVF